jgi:hypothetical protein
MNHRTARRAFAALVTIIKVDICASTDLGNSAEICISNTGKVKCLQSILLPIFCKYLKGRNSISACGESPTEMSQSDFATQCIRLRMAFSPFSRYPSTPVDKQPPSNSRHPMNGIS